MASFTANPSNDNAILVSPNATWSTVRDAVSGSLFNDQYNIAWCDYRSGDGGFEMHRPFENFDTSALGAGAVITEATLELYPEGRAGDTVHFALYGSTAQDTIVGGDFDEVGSTILSDQILLSDITVNTKFHFTLNAAGLAYINRTGITKFCIREVEHDVANVAPTADTLRRFWFTNNTGATSGNRPLLAITYTAATNVTVTPAVLSATFSIPSAAVTGDAVVAPSPLAATFSILSYSILTVDAVISPTAIAATFSIPTYSVITDAVIAPSPLTATFSLPAPTVLAVQNIILTPSPLVLTFSLLTPSRIGGLWTNQGRSSAATLTNQARPSTSWDNQERSEH